MGGVDFSNLFLVLKDGATPSPYASLAAAKEVGAVTVAYGALINTVINFLIVAFALFLAIKGMNVARRQQAAVPPPPPPPPSAEQKLLTEIRDLLARK